eukprot:TRINITY_DN3029_c0_g1_i1.p1 TRINITY_DN3029_c0_g1~~TRINITY_DN3029_c0_g1_i1.p1  ORF type:complete len:109 (+),score=17.55 TRINITY_DN3029_c0_g1_i1:255-581(+)
MGRKRESCDSQEESLEKDSKDEENGNTKKKTEKKAKKEVQRVENKTREIRIPLKDITNVSRTASLATRENLKRSAERRWKSEMLTFHSWASQTCYCLKLPPVYHRQSL